jgi:hypothetical protein
MSTDNAYHGATLLGVRVAFFLAVAVPIPFPLPPSAAHFSGLACSRVEMDALAMPGY